jgi:hypothetical protein
MIEHRYNCRGIVMHAARVAGALLFFGTAGLVIAGEARAQNPVFLPALEIDQTKLVTNCPHATDPGCAYSLKDVLDSGGDFWTTPFQPYDPVTKTGDGYGEGVKGPRADQRHAFNPQPQQPPYRFLRLNGLDSQSCFECHNSIGSDPVDPRGALSRKSYTVGGSAGSNSNAFINPLFPTRLTLFIRNPPAVFGSGYQQAVGDEMTIELFLQRDRARATAKRDPGKPFSQPLTAKGVAFGTFTTTYIAGSPAKVLADATTCPAGLGSATNAESIGGASGYTDDLRKLEGVSCDLVIRPFQWKGVSSSLRHFVRDALDFHFSMQAFEKVALCDCDRDGKAEEVTMGNLTAMSSFVAMLRPPVATPPDQMTPEQKHGEDIFFGKASGSYQSMCANCHVGPRPLVTPTVLVEWPTSAQGANVVPIDRTNPATWPILEKSCPGGTPPNMSNACPVESSYSASTKVAQLSASAQNRGALVSPVASSQQLSIVRRYKLNLAAAPKERALETTAPLNTEQLSANITALRAVLKPLATASASAVGQDYVIPLTPPDGSVTPIQLPRLKENADHTVDVPLFSDLKRHNMGTNLSDPAPPAPSQGTDVLNINTSPQEFMTRPLWGVADTGPWLHDGRAMTLKEAIVMHGDRVSGSEAGPVVEAFEHLSASDQNALVSFLETLRLPLPGGAP